MMGSSCSSSAVTAITARPDIAAPPTSLSSSSSSSSSAQKKHVIFDFDCTLTARHWWKGLYMGQFMNDTSVTQDLSPDEVNFLASDCEFVAHKNPLFSKMSALLRHTWGGEERLESVKNMLHTLQAAGVSIHISTNGQTNEVIGVLRVSGIPLENFVYVHGYDDVRKKKIAYNIPMGSYDNMYRTRSKIEFIEKVCGAAGKDNCVYIDDDPSEYVGASKYCQTIDLQKESTGMTTEHIQQLLSALAI